jgi:hypothetical protein
MNTNAVHSRHKLMLYIPVAARTTRRFFEDILPMIFLGVVCLVVLRDPYTDFRSKQIDHELFVGDPVLYFAHMHSFIEDGDIDFADDYAELDPTLHKNLKKTLPSGKVGNIFPPGSALLWSPFYIGMKVYIAFNDIDNRDRQLNLLLYSAHIGTVACAALYLIFTFLICTRFTNYWYALLASISSLYATSLFCFVDSQRIYSHAPAAFAVALLIWLAIRKPAEERSRVYWFVLGLVAGLVASIRMLDIVVISWFLVEQIPILIERLSRKRSLTESFIKYGFATGGAVITLLPSILVLWELYGFGGSPLDHGANTFWPLKPRIFELLFASRHGLLSWHPIVLLAFIGLGFLFWRGERKLAIKALVVLALGIYVNACIGDWFAGASFGARRLVTFTAIFAMGFAALLEFSNKWLRVVVVALLFSSFLWNFDLWNRQVHNSDFTDARSVDANPINPDRWLRVNSWANPVISPAMDIAALPLGISGKALDWILCYEIDSRQYNLEGEIEVNTPAYQQGFSQPQTDERGLYRLFSNTGSIYFYCGKLHFLYNLRIEADLEGSSLQKNRRPALLIYVNDKAVGLMTARQKGAEQTWGSFFLKPKDQNYVTGLNKIEVRKVSLDRAFRPSFKNLSEILANPEFYGFEHCGDDMQVKIRRTLLK